MSEKCLYCGGTQLLLSAFNGEPVDCTHCNKLYDMMDKIVPSKNKMLYRFVDWHTHYQLGFKSVSIASIEVYEVIKETKHSYQIDLWYSERESYQKSTNVTGLGKCLFFNMGDRKKWIRKAKTYPFARETVEDALNHYLIRKEKHIKFLDEQLTSAKECRQSALNLKGEK